VAWDPTMLQMTSFFHQVDPRDQPGASICQSANIFFKKKFVKKIPKLPKMQVNKYYYFVKGKVGLGQLLAQSRTIVF
jgi:hypothetical protein